MNWRRGLFRLWIVGSVLFVIVLAFFSYSSTAQAQEVKSVIVPLGFSCDKWTSTPRESPDHERLRQWILGYLSGANMESPGGRETDFLRGRDADALTECIDDYCRRNPLHLITQAIYELIKELRPRRSPI